MTERERDKRDLAILADLDDGHYPPDVAKKYNVSRWHIMALLEGVLQ
jgi:Mor family transcriptional regulator